MNRTKSLAVAVLALGGVTLMFFSVAPPAHATIDDPPATTLGGETWAAAWLYGGCCDADGDYDGDGYNDYEADPYFDYQGDRQNSDDMDDIMTPCQGMCTAECRIEDGTFGSSGTGWSFEHCYDQCSGTYGCGNGRGSSGNGKKSPGTVKSIK